MSAKRLVRILGAASIVALSTATIAAAQTSAPSAAPNRNVPAAKDNTQGAQIKRSWKMRLASSSSRAVAGAGTYSDCVPLR